MPNCQEKYLLKTLFFSIFSDTSITQFPNRTTLDYAKKFRTDFLDIYLGAKCDFFVCRAVGIFAIPMVFRRSRVYVNFIPLDYIDSWGSKCISIFKKLWLRRERRFMTFRAIFESGVGRFLRTEQYDKV